MKKKSLYIFLGILLLFTSCVQVEINSHRLRFPNSEARKIFIKAHTIAEDEIYLANMVEELKYQLGMKGWEVASYEYQVKSVKDDPLEIERRILSFNPDLLLEFYLSDQLASTEYIPSNYSSNPAGASGSYHRTASSDIELNLIDSSDGIPIWQANMTVKISNESFKPKLKAGSEVSSTVMEIIQAMEKDGILYTLPAKD